MTIKKQLEETLQSLIGDAEENEHEFYQLKEMKQAVANMGINGLTCQVYIGIITDGKEFLEENMIYCVEIEAETNVDEIREAQTDVDVIDVDEINE